MIRTAILSITVLLSIHANAQTLETVLQQGHELAVVAVAVSPDSNYVATGSKDKSAKLWEVSSGREVRSFLGHDKTVTALAFSADGKTLVTGGNDRTLRIWNVETGKEQFLINTVNIITDLAIDKQMRFFIATGYSSLSWGDSAQVYDWKTRRLVTKIAIAPDKGLGYGVSVAISDDGKYVAFGEDNRVATVYQTSDWKQTNKFEFEEGWCGGCATKVMFSPDSRFLYMASYKGPMRKYSIPSGKLERNYVDTQEELTSLAISNDGKLLARCTEKEITIWDEPTGTQLHQLIAGEKEAFHEVQFSAAKKLWVTSDDNTAFLFNGSTNKKEKILTGILNERDAGGLNYDPNFYWQSAIARYVRFKNQLLITRDGKSLIKGKFGAKVKRWDVASGQTQMHYTGHQKAVLCYDLSQDGKKLLTGGGDGKIVVWDLDSGDSLKVIRSYREPIFDIQFSPDETKILSSSWDANMKIHDIVTGKLLTYFEYENSSVYDALFHPNGLYVFTARLDNSLQLWEIDTRTSVRNFVGHTDIVSSIRLSNDEKTLLSAGWDGSIRLWDVGTGLMNRKLMGHSGAVHLAIFSPDAKQVVSAGADRTIRFWDMATGKIARTFEGHQAEVTSVLFSPDNKMLISHSVDGVTKFWDLSTGREFFEHIHFGEKEWMAKNPEGYFHGTDGARKYVHFVEGMKTYAVDQFFDDFYRPDLLPKIFQNRGGSSESKSLQGKLQQSPPPQLKLALIPSADPAKAELYVRVTDSGGGADNLKLFHNGKSLVVDKTRLQLPNSTGKNTTYQQSVTLVAGPNVFSATATNKDRMESAPATVEYFSDQTAKNSTCYLLAVGINQYKNPRMSLNYAKPDAESFLDVMDKKGTALFKQVELHTLYDQEASRQNILKKMDELAAKAHPEDVFVFYYAGHGSMVDNQFFFIPSESLRLYDAGSLKNEAIEASVLQEKFKNIKALKQLIIMDACQSGASVELLATRGAAEEKAIAQLSRSAGIHVMASAGSEQFATEFAELGHGLFTYLLIKALQGDADGAPKDGKVTIYELKSYLDDQVPEMTRTLKGKPQYPYTFSRGQDFPVVIGH